MYASFLETSGPLPLDIFEHPDLQDFFSNLLVLKGDEAD
jgi:hypothetical protein